MMSVSSCASLAIVYNDHKRTVNKVQFQPESNVLASGAQDGTIKLFVRQITLGVLYVCMSFLDWLICQDSRVNRMEAVKTFVCNSESVRDIQVWWW